MFRKFQKPLIYLVAIMLALPTWVVTALSAPGTVRAGVDLINPTLNSVGFVVSKNAGPSQPMDTSSNGSYALGIDNKATSNYKIDFSTATVASETLKDQYFALYLNPTTANVAALETYYNTHSSGDWKTYLKAAANGTNPFAYIKQDGLAIKLIDAAKHDIASFDAPMQIPGDYVTGTYVVNGVISDLANNLTAVSYTILIDGSQPVINIINPTHKEVVSGGTIYQIKWTAEDLESGIKNDSVKIEFSEDNIGWTMVNDAAANNGSYDWNVPKITDDNVYIRISARNNAGLEEVKKSSDFEIKDNTAPVITLIGDNPLTVVKDAIMTVDTIGASVTDNYDGVSTIYGSGVVNTSILGDYTWVYTASDAAGNAAASVTRTIKVVAATLSSPDVTVSGSGKTLNISWTAVTGATGYYVYVGTTAGSSYVYKSAELPAATTSYSQTEGDYGTYYVRVTAVNASGVESADSVSKQKSIVLAAATTTSSTATTTSATASATATVVEPAQAASSASTGSSSSSSAVSSDNTSTSGDDNQGKIKGEDENATTSEEEEKVNWTPWIILFILIILAGAATGGYFYWFAGEEEIKESAPKEEAKPVAKNNKPKSANSSSSNSSKNSKKSKRW